MDRLLSNSMLDMSRASVTSVRGNLNRRNTTSTMHVTETMARPDNVAMISAVAEKLHAYVADGEMKRRGAAASTTSTSTSTSTTADASMESGMKKLRLNAGPGTPMSTVAENAENAPPASQTAIPGSGGDKPQHGGAAAAGVDGLPSPRDVAQYLQMIFTTAQCSVDCTIVCLIYIERLLTRSGLNLTTRNWKPLVAVGMLLASKVWDDLSMLNADFAVFLPYTMDQINSWERQFLGGMQYDVRVSASQYAAYYFDLRQASVARGTVFEIPDDESPLDVERAQFLEANSSVVQKRIDQMRAGRSRMDHRRAVSDQHLVNTDSELLPDAPDAHHLQTPRRGHAVLD